MTGWMHHGPANARILIITSLYRQKKVFTGFLVLYVKNLLTFEIYSKMLHIPNFFGESYDRSQ
jgi:hypothetical protein